MAANRARQPPPGLRGNAYPEAINRTLVFFGVTYTPVFANITMEFPPFLDVFSIGKNWWISLISIAMATFYWYGYIKSKKNEQKITEQNPTSWWLNPTLALEPPTCRFQPLRLYPQASGI